MKDGRMSRRELFKYTAALGITLAVPWRVDGIARAARQASYAIPQTPLPVNSIPKYVEPMPVFGSNLGIVPGQVNAPRVTGTEIMVTANEVQQPVLPASFYSALPVPYRAGTWVWAYNVGNTLPLYPGISIEAQRGVPTNVTYENCLPATGSVVQQYLDIDQSIHWANPLNAPMMTPDPNHPGAMLPNPDPYAGPPPIVAHLHGAEVDSSFDGGPDQWFTPDGIHGKGYDTYVSAAPNAAVYHYVNEQEATTLWFHDHALGATRINVYAGMAAFYFLRDKYDTGRPDNPLNLPAGPYEREIAIQDRMFDINGQWLFPASDPDDGLNGPPPNPQVHPFWNPEFFGNVFVVNGKSWPYFNVEPRRYRFRLLDGCNARFLELRLMNRDTHKQGPAFWVIGTDGGLLDKPAKLNDPALPGSKGPRLLMAPGERYDVIIDFAGYAGQTLTLVNSAKAPYPMGTAPDPDTTGEVMQFRVGKTVTGGSDPSFNPASGNNLRNDGSMPPIIRLANPATGTLAKDVQVSKTRLLTLVEVEAAGGPEEVLVNNTKWKGQREEFVNGKEQLVPVWDQAQKDDQGNYVTELPQVGDTEIWEIVNTTMDAHPIHLHLTQFQLMNRQAFNATQYRALYDSHFPGGDYDGFVPDAGDEMGEVLYPPGVFIPAYGPPLDYDPTKNPLSGGKWGGNPDVSPFLSAKVKLPLPEEAGWKDTVKMYPGEVTRIVVRFAPQDTALNGVQPGQNLYGFDPTVGPGYVWHCHIVDHEDNEMMRPYHPVA